jgi:pSer/pThr/pTyr-binding forkhead associated (FHA) protein
VTFPAEMRVGSLEVLGALVVFAAVVGRRRFTPVPRVAHELRLELSVNGRIVELTVCEGQPPRVVGRSSEADVPIGDAEASRRHAGLQVAAGTLYVTDLGSRNGTFLNGKRLSSEGIELKIGDHIDVGNTRIEVLEAQALP